MPRHSVAISIHVPDCSTHGASLPVGFALLNVSDSEVHVTRCIVTSSLVTLEGSSAGSASVRKAIVTDRSVEPRGRWCGVVEFTLPDAFVGIVKLEGELAYRVAGAGLMRHVERLAQKLSPSAADPSRPSTSERRSSPSSPKEISVPWELETRVLPLEVPSQPDWYAGDFCYSWHGADDGIPTEFMAKAAERLGLSWVVPIQPDGSETASHQVDHAWQALDAEIERIGSGVLLVPAQELKLASSSPRRTGLLLIGEGTRRTECREARDSLPRTAPKGHLTYATGPFSRQDVDSPLLFKEGITAKAGKAVGLPQLTGLKIWNGHLAAADVDDQFHWGSNLWTALLLSGERLVVVGGSDGLARLLLEGRTVRSRWKQSQRCSEHVLGTIRTLVQCPDGLSRRSLLDGLSEGRVIVSEGPFVSFAVHNELGDSAQIGGSVEGQSFAISITATSTEEYGEFQEVAVRGGSFAKKNEEILVLLQRGISEDMKCITFEDELDVPAGYDGYLRIEAYSRRDDRVFYAFTNPIWVTRLQA